MKPRRWVQLLFCLFLLGLLVPSVGQGATPSVVENLSHKILFQSGNDLFMVGENGEGLTKVLAETNIYNIAWSKDGATFTVEGASRNAVGVEEYVFEEGGRLVSKLNRRATPRVGPHSYTYYSARGNFYVEAIDYSEPLWTVGSGDPFTYRILLKRKNGELIGELAQRAYPAVTWSGRENKFAFFTREPGCVAMTQHCAQFVNVYSLETGSVAQFEGLFNYPLAFLLNGSKLFYFPVNNIPGIADLETGGTTLLEGIEMYYPSEGIPEGMFKLAEAGTKVVFATVSFNFATYKLKDGVYVYDLETGKVLNLVEDSINSFEVVGDKVVYAGYSEPGLFITSLSGGTPRKIASVSSIGQISIQPRIPANRYKNRRVLVLAQGIGTEVSENATYVDMFPDLAPIIDEALDRGIYQDVILYSYNGGSMVNGQWVPISGGRETSFQHLRLSVATFGHMLDQYAAVHKGVIFDFGGFSLGGKIEWEYLKYFLDSKITAFDIRRTIHLASPINGRHRDAVFEGIVDLIKVDKLIASGAVDDLHDEAWFIPAQIYTEIENQRYYLEAARREILVHMLGSEDDCFVPYLSQYPYNSSVISGLGVVYKGLGRGTKGGVRITNCTSLDDNPFDVRDLYDIYTLVSNKDDIPVLFSALGHDRLLWKERVWIDLKNLMLLEKTPISDLS